MQRFIPFIALVALAIPVSLFSAGSGGGGGGGGGGGTPPCTDQWTCGEWNECTAAGDQTRTCTLTSDCATDSSPAPAQTQRCTPRCTQDTWNCSTWSACAGGKQTRTCTKTNDCDLIETPKPIESQSCQDACAVDTWTCGAWGECSVGGTQTRTCNLTQDCPSAVTPKPEESRACTPRCTEDKHRCTDWGPCDPVGQQKRTCTLTEDCPGVTTAKPQEARVCPQLQCGNLPTLRERVKCRINLTPQGMARELQIQYLPEECRALPKNLQQRCINLYKSYLPCWERPQGEPRALCARIILGMTGDIPATRRACADKPPQEREACLQDVRGKVYNIIKFRIYDLEERAEDLAEDGKVPFDAAAEFVVFIQETKQKFNNAKSKQERRQLILDVRARWQKFVRDNNLK